MKEGLLKNLGSVATFINGYPFKPSEWHDTGKPIIRIQNLNNPNAPYNYYDGDIDTKFIVSKGDVLISWSGSLGVFEWQNNNAAYLNQHIFKVLFNKEAINKSFFMYAVSSRINEMKGKVHGITMQHITKGEFDKTQIPVPSLEEQERIVAELDLLTGIIDKQKTQVKELDTLAQSIFYDMFGNPVENKKGWEKRVLADIAEVGSSRRIFAEEYTDKGVPFYRIKEIVEKSQKKPLSVELFISEKRYTEIKSKNGIPSVGDILITAVGTIGEIWVVDSEEPFYFKDGNIIWLQGVSTDVNSIFFRFQLEALIEDYKKKVSIGSAYSALTIVKLKQLVCPIPPKDVQDSFANKVKIIEHQKQSITRSIAETQKLFDSAMDKYFG